MKARRAWRQRLFLLFNCVVICSALVSAWILQGVQARTEAVSRVTLPGALRASDEQAGPGDRVLNFLLVGSDSSEGLDPDDPIQIGRQGERQSDVIIIAHVDEPNRSVTLFSIPRDLWVPIAGQDSSNRINSAFAFGGPAVLIETIKETMDVEIDYYVNVDFAGFQDLVAVVGGVEVYFPTPARDWDSRYNISRTGFEVLSAGCHYLDPVQSLAYVRSRHYQTMDAEGNWVDDDLGDLSRIERQQDFLQRLLAEAISQGARNPFKLRELVDETLDAVTIDDQLTGQLLIDLATNLRQFEAEELVTYAYPVKFDMIERKSVVVGLDDEVEPILELLRGASPLDPKTVFVAFTYDPLLQAEAADVVSALSLHGFGLGAAQPAAVEPGFVLRHGDDGLGAALVLRDALIDDGAVAEDVRIQYSQAVSGRTVALSYGPPAEAAATNDGPSESTDPVPTTAPNQAPVSEPPAGSLQC